MGRKLIVLALVPSFYGSSGDAVNERQFLLSLARKVEKCYIITQIGILEMITLRNYIKTFKANKPSNLVIIPIPIPKWPLVIYIITSIFISFFIAIVTTGLVILKKINIIYARGSWLTPGILAVKSLRERTVVKIPALMEGEVTKRGILKIIIDIVSLLDRLAIMYSKYVIAPSPTMASLIEKRRSLRPNKPWLIIPAGVNLKLIEHIYNDRGIKNRTKNIVQIGFIGTLTWWQGVDVLVKAIAIVMKLFSAIEFIIIGDGPMKENIIELCKKYNVRCKITGFIPHQEALRLLSSLDMIVLPSKRTFTTESIIPIKVIEAWALGIPVIITRHKVFIEMGFRDREDLIYCEPEPYDVAKAILRLLRNENLRCKLSENGPKLAKKFSYSKMAERLLNMFIKN